MNIAHQLPEIDILLADDGFVPVLKQMPVTVMATVEVASVTSQEATHKLREPGRTAAEEDVGMVPEDCPGIHLGLRLRGSLPESGQEFDTIRIILDDLATLHPPQDDVVKSTWGIQSSLTGHAILLQW
jgi:hypothetical protein